MIGVVVFMFFMSSAKPKYAIRHGHGKRESDCGHHINRHLLTAMFF